jgi:hypothetical protein
MDAERLFHVERSEIPSKYRKIKNRLTCSTTAEEEAVPNGGTIASSAVVRGDPKKERAMFGRSPGEGGLAAFCFCLRDYVFHARPCEAEGLVAEIRSEVRWTAGMALEKLSDLERASKELVPGRRQLVSMASRPGLKSIIRPIRTR